MQAMSASHRLHHFLSDSAVQDARSPMDEHGKRRFNA